MVGNGMQEWSLYHNSPHDRPPRALLPLERNSTQEQSAISHHQTAQDHTVVKDYDRCLTGRFPFSHTGNVEGSHSADKHQHI
jgi:hypothetical protein